MRPAAARAARCYGQANFELFRRIYAGFGRSGELSGGFAGIWADYAEFIAEIWGICSGIAEKNFGGAPSERIARPYQVRHAAAADDAECSVLSAEVRRHGLVQRRKIPDAMVDCT